MSFLTTLGELLRIADIPVRLVNKVWKKSFTTVNLTLSQNSSILCPSPPFVMKTICKPRTRPINYDRRILPELII